MPAAVSGRRGSIKFRMNYHISVADGTRDLPRAVMNPSDSLSHLTELQRLNKFLSNDGVYPNDSRLLMFSICLFELAFLY